MRQAARSGWVWVRSSIDAQDVVLALGLALLSIGAGKVYDPLEWIIPGAAFTALAWPKRPVMIVKRQPPQES